MSYDNPPPAATPRPRKRRKGMGAAAKMGLLLFGALLVLGIVGAGAAVAAYTQLSQGLPNPEKLETIALPEQSIVWDREHKVELARFGEFNREVVAF